MATKRIYFVRHGEAEGNKGGFAQLDNTPLTDTGRAQAERVAKRFTNLSIEAVLASHYDRAHDTAVPIAAEKDLSVETVEYFHEVDKPTSVRGQLHSSEVYQNYRREEKENYADPEWRYEDGENFGDILKRVQTGIELLEQRPEKELVVVTHGRLLRFIMAYLLNKKQLTADVELRMINAMRATNTGITVFEVDKADWKLVTFNDLAHFAE